MTQVLFAAAARSELIDAAHSYEHLRSSLGRTFAAEVALTLARIQAFPSIAPVVSEPFRRAVMKRFPFCVVYRVVADDVQIIAVFPTRADPKALDDRLTSVG